jgi:2-haloacid dehalogenase
METVSGHNFSSEASKKDIQIISNTDDDLFAASAKHLEVAFDMVVTAQQARSYKPALNIFLLAIKQARVSKTEILHAGQSVYHDIIPAQSLGLANVWVNRRSGRNGSGATKSASAIPDVEVPDLKSLAALAMQGPIGRQMTRRSPAPTDLRVS